MAELPKALKSYIIAHLRRIGYRNVHRAAAFEKAHLGRAQWQCQQCRQIFPSSKDLHGDHILPVVDPDTGFTNFEDYINKLFLGEIQALCKECHKQKSESENVVRREKRKWDNID
jgi:5-methylcytosine-specific restriction endonuclease McrA